VQVGWREGGRLGFLFVNLLADEEQAVTLAADPAAYGLGACTATVTTSDATHELASLDGAQELTLALPPRRVVLLELEPRDRE
jgi:hypothetical protein